MISYNHPEFIIGAAFGLASKLNGALADVWFTPTYFDITDLGVRRDFINPHGYPVCLGRHGHGNVLRLQPVLWLYEMPHPVVPTVRGFRRADQLPTHAPIYSKWEANHGSGGPFTVQGTLTETAGPGPGA